MVLLYNVQETAVASAFRPINDASGVVGTSKSIGGVAVFQRSAQTVELIVESFLRLCPKPIVNTGENDYEVVTPVLLSPADVKFVVLPL